jgi:hypothetical protein
MGEVTPELERARRGAEERLLGLPGATGVDIGYKEVGGVPTETLAIRVLVAEKKPTSAVPRKERIPEEIDGQPVDVIERRFELHQIGASIPIESLPAEVDSASYDPLRGGISIGPCRVVDGFVHAGTLGAVVTDSLSGRALAMSSFHVMCVDTAATVGDPVAQPSRVDGGSCPGSVIGGLWRHALTSSVDAAVADVSPFRAVAFEVVEVGALTGLGTVSLGDVVLKRGRTTRLTFGLVDSVDLAVKLDYGNGIGVKTLNRQIGVRPDVERSQAFMGKGDTGSVLLNEARQVVGLLVAGTDAGYGVANPIADVLQALNVRLEVGFGPKLRVETKMEKDGLKESEFHNDLEDGKDHADKRFEDGQKNFKDQSDRLGKSRSEMSSDPRSNQDKDKDEVKDRKEDSDLKQFEDRAKTKTIKDMLIEKPRKEDAFNTELKMSLKSESDQSIPASFQGRYDPIEQRVAFLEGAVAQLRHFIDPSLRPDLRQGALTGETDVSREQGSRGESPDDAGGRGDAEEQPDG